TRAALRPQGPALVGSVLMDRPVPPVLGRGPRRLGRARRRRRIHMTAKSTTQANAKTAPPAQPAAPPPFPVGKPTKLGDTSITLNKGKTTSLRLVRVIQAPPERIYRCF